jgi:hypothetical protein
MVMFALAPARAGDGRDMLAFGVGAYDANFFDGRSETSAGFSAEYRAGFGLWLVHPLIGFMATSDSVIYGYGGIIIDIPLGDRLFVSPNFAAGVFHTGSGKELGHTVEFRTGIELSYRLDDDSRLGVLFHHMSNADLGNKNPGSESLFVTYAVPVDKLFGR